MLDVRKSLIDKGWKQGVLTKKIDDNRFCAFAHFDLGDDALYLIISQTCDLVNPSFEDEPYFEVLRLTPIEGEPSPVALGGKNSRVIHFQIGAEYGAQSFQSLPYERFFIDRTMLLDHDPEGFLDEGTCGMVNAWLSKRLVRTAFPDKFDQRWKERRKQIEKIIKRLKLVKDIYIAIEPFSELDDGMDYEVALYLLLDANDFDDAGIHAEYTKHKDALEVQFNQCPNIDLLSIDLISDAEFTVRELQTLRRWDYSYLSYREPEEHAAPVLVS
jgi:hypothetical protein